MLERKPTTVPKLIDFADIFVQIVCDVERKGFSSPSIQNVIANALLAFNRRVRNAPSNKTSLGESSRKPKRLFHGKTLLMLKSIRLGWALVALLCNYFIYHLIKSLALCCMNL
jgi:hypothetical protein